MIGTVAASLYSDHLYARSHSSAEERAQTPIPASVSASVPANAAKPALSSSASRLSADTLLEAQKHQGQAGADNVLEQTAELQKLQKRDTEVRAHEQAHAAAGGNYAGAPSYEYQKGPDGKLYAVGGETPIDTAPVADDPQATIAKMETVIRAALAPAQPSSQDLKVAAQAQQAKTQAQIEARQGAEA